MTTRREFLKALGVGAIVAPAAVAGTVVGNEAKKTGLVSKSAALGFSEKTLLRAREVSRGKFYVSGTERPKFISPPSQPCAPYAVNFPGDTGTERPRLIAPSSRPYTINVAGRDLPIKNIKLDLHDQTFRIQHIRADELDISSKTFTLRIREEGTEYLLDTMFTAKPLIKSWHFGLIDNAGFTAMCHMDRYATSCRGWNEACEYWGGRPHWNVFTDEGATFHMRGPAIIKGIFVAGGPLAINKNDHSPGGVLWAMSLFDQGDIFVANGDTLTIKGYK